MAVEALVAERTLALALVVVFAIFNLHCLLVAVDQFVLFLFCVDPQAAGHHKVGRDAALGAGPLDLVVKLGRLTPLADALKAEAVTAVGQDAEALLLARLLHDHLEADATGALFGLLHGKRQLHVLFVVRNALQVVQSTLLLICRMQAKLLAQLTEVAVQVDALVVVVADAGTEQVRAQAVRVGGRALFGLPGSGIIVGEVLIHDRRKCARLE